MKPKNFIWIVLVIALVGFGFWWFMRPMAVAPEKTVVEPIPTKVDVSGLSKVEAPKPVAPPVQSKPETANAPTKTVEATPAPADPQAELKTTFADIARLERAADFAAILQTYTPPDKLNLDTVQQTREAQARVAHDPAALEAIAQAWESLVNEIPTYNAAGDEATYPMPPVNLPGQSAPLLSAPVTFIKINGKWYIKGD